MEGWRGVGFAGHWGGGWMGRVGFERWWEVEGGFAGECLEVGMGEDVVSWCCGRTEVEVQSGLNSQLRRCLHAKKSGGM